MSARNRPLVLWLAVSLVGVLLLWLAFPYAFPLLSDDWQVTRSEARAIALERLRDLGEPIDNAYVVVELDGDGLLERRLLEELPAVGNEAVRSSLLAKAHRRWEVRVYSPGARVREWVYQCLVAFDGEVLALRRRLPRADAEEAIDETDAMGQALTYLRSQGIDLGGLEHEPKILRDQRTERRDLTLQYRFKDSVLGADLPHGWEVWFTGDTLAGFGLWYEDPKSEQLGGLFRQLQLINFGQYGIAILLLVLVTIPFLKRYHDGQLGVRRGAQLLLAVLAAGLVFVLLCSQSMSSGANVGFLTRRQTTWFIGTFVVLTQMLMLGMLALTSWSVGESLCRDRWPQKLASFDALFRLRWANATVALSSLRGIAGGLLMAGLLVGGAALLRRAGAWIPSSMVMGMELGTALPSLALLSIVPSFLLAPAIFVCLLLPTWASDRLGDGLGLVISVLAAAILLPMFLIALPLQWGFLAWALAAVVPVLIFRYGDLLSALLTVLFAALTPSVMPLLGAVDPAIQVHGYATLLIAALPMLLSLRRLGSDDEFVYFYDDVPPHVRRIAERERQSVELETARRIQSSILPRLPPQLNGVEIAHSYLPASEVGGDFYDVLALEDGRLAVAVGDVAGHGVSSGLVMSMAKSALAVQVSFNPEIEAVLETLNRTVYQGARQRLLTTLCYALIDPARNEMLYASAGHLFPYRVSANGQVEPLVTASYPLGVRGEIDVQVKNARLEDGDTVFLYSDGLVEATPEASDEPFGFTRLEASLARHAGMAPGQLRDAVLLDVEAFTGAHPRADDLTVLVLRLGAN